MASPLEIDEEDAVKYSELRSSASSISRAMRLGFLFLAALPWLALISILLEALRVRLGQGTWPTYSIPDPKTLGLQHSLSWILVFAGFAMAVITPLSLLAAFMAGKRRLPLWPIAVALLGVITLALFFRLDPQGLADWFVD